MDRLSSNNSDFIPESHNIKYFKNKRELIEQYLINKRLHEEIVNPKNKGRMTKRDILKRDRLADKVDAKPIKGKDTKINTKHRLATYIIMKNKGDE